MGQFGREDLKLSEGGVWMDYAAGVRLLIAKHGNRAHKLKLRKLVQGNKDKFRGLEVRGADLVGTEQLSDEQLLEQQELMRELQGRALAGTVLLDWSGLEYPHDWDFGTQDVNAPLVGGDAQPFSEADAEVYLTDRRYDKLYEDVTELSTTASEFRDKSIDKQREEAQGN